MSNTQSVQELDKGCYQYKYNKPFKLSSEKNLDYLELYYETYGELSPAKNNVILVHHSLSMSAHASSYNQTDTTENSYSSAWWDNMIGDSKPLDTSKYFIICINNLGSCFGSSGPTTYNNFPAITIHDMVNSQKLLLDYLGINKLKLVVGSSMGGMISLAWLQLYPMSLENLFVACASVKSYPINILNRLLQREIVNLDQNSQNSFKIARMLGFTYYRSPCELNKRFNNISTELIESFYNNSEKEAYKNTELYKYFDYNSEKFAKSFNKESYNCLLNAMDLFDLTTARNYHSAGFGNVNNSIKITIAGIDSDLLFPLYQQYDIYKYLVESGYEKTRFIEHKSTHGHDAFLVDSNAFGRYITDNLI